MLLSYSTRTKSNPVFQRFPARNILSTTLLVFLSFLVCLPSRTLALRRPTTKAFGTRFESIALIQVRGGSSSSNLPNNEPIELNPHYQHYYVPPRHLQNEHEIWLQQQQQQQQQQSTFTFTGRKEPSLIDRAQNYFVLLHKVSPALFWTTLTCIGVFCLWRVPSLNRWPNSILYRYFLNTEDNAKRTLGASMILSSMSHISPYHLLVNLVTLSQLGPTVRQLLQHSRPLLRSSGSWKSVMWPLMASSAIFSNGLYLLGSPRGASSLGLSGVTMALLAIQARAYPERKYGIVLGVIPVSLRAKELLLILLAVSLIGTWSSSASWGRWRGIGSSKTNVAHLGHLGGLIYGLLYYELVILARTPQQVVHRILSSLRR